MSRFATQFKRSAADHHLRYHGETISYFRSGEHNARSYRAVIERNLVEIIREVGDVSARSMILAIYSSSDKAKGILPGEVNTDSDYVAAPFLVGETASEFTVLKVLTSHAGLTRVLVG
jgi:hypothetical protein